MASRPRPRPQNLAVKPRPRQRTHNTVRKYVYRRPTKFSTKNTVIIIVKNDGFLIVITIKYLSRRRRPQSAVDVGRSQSSIEAGSLSMRSAMTVVLS